MSRVRVGMSRKSIERMIERGRYISGKMTGNANFATPNPTLLVVNGATDALELAFQEAMTHDSVKIQIRDLRLKDFKLVFNQLGAYVQNASGGDAEIILSSGFDVVGPRTPLPPLTQVMNLRLKKGSDTGKVAAKWDKVTGAKVYVVFVTNDPLVDDNFKPVGATTRTSFELTGLTPGQKYWVKVAGVGKDGLGPASEPIAKIAE